MEFKSQDIFSLSDKGKKEYGHIFCEGVVPVKYKYLTDFSFREVLERRVDEDRMRLAPEILEKFPNGNLVCIVDWEKMTEVQRTALVEKLSVAFKSSASQIRGHLNLLGYFPMQAEYVREI